jgi:peptidoglycan-associated lipoprotein
MNTRNVRSFALFVVAAVAIGALGCQNKAKPKTVPEAPSVEVETPQAHVQAQPAAPVAEPFPQTPVEKTSVGEGTIDELNARGVLRTVYFGYNSNDLDDEAKSTLQANAAWLKAHPTYHVEIGGHCDERGSIGYNVALGDRRAASVKTYLTGSGVGAGQLVTISYGEEKPAVQGHDEAAWAKNRRAEFLIKP